MGNSRISHQKFGDQLQIQYNREFHDYVLLPMDLATAALWTS